MVTILAEQPLMIAIMIGVFTAGLAYAWMQTGDKRLALASLVTLILIPGAFYVADAITTDREKILAAIHTTVNAVQDNDFETAVQVIGDKGTRARALVELPNYEFNSIGVRNIQIKMVQGSLPQEAAVDLDATVVASQVRGGFKNQRVPRRVILTFQKQPDESWLVTDYTHKPLIGPADNFTPNRI